MANNDVDGKRFKKALIDMALESWRFLNAFRSAMSKLSEEDYARYQGRYLWFRRRLDEIAESAGLQIVEINPGEPYDTGMAATPLNIGDFKEDENLLIEQMIEPIIMEGGSVVKGGTVILGRQEE